MADRMDADAAMGPGADQSSAPEPASSRRPALLRRRPSRPRIDRRGDVAVVPRRAMLPIGVAALMLQPVVHQQGLVLQPLEPHLAPALAHQRRVGRMGLEGEHGRAPGEIIDQQAAAHVVDVIGIAVIGGAERDHRLQLLRPARRHLQPVEAAPGDSDHAAGARAPGLRLKPFQHSRQSSCSSFRYSSAAPRRIRRCRGCRPAPSIAMAGAKKGWSRRRGLCRRAGDRQYSRSLARDGSASTAARSAPPLVPSRTE